MLEDFVRLVNASKKTRIKSEFEFIEFDDVSGDKIKETGKVPEKLHMYAEFNLHYDGELPGNSKMMNKLLEPWVTQNEKKLNKVIIENLKKFFEKNYEGSETADFDETDNIDVIDDHQLNYDPVPNADENKKSFTIEIKLDIEAELKKD